MEEVLRRDARNAYHNRDDHEHNQEQLEVARRSTAKVTSTTGYTTRDGPVLGTQRVMQFARSGVKRKGSGMSRWGSLSARSTISEG
ncbi:hypothetical protein D0863_13297 [Hortaea werneckii]|uniref:Uncharacterized protein n=1 Tax=Hortaea werneckii TaxID=91943 RepID=A0A3M7CUV0_HORWE|nr:hypothetical protein D0863_13297 [Hortaea werneckii]